ncbi:uncharacterized protein LOC133034521 [Cannabis sativa]|uniref:uncharacterized protein LOC133034521 n=1 Tax=Cannabis sativa TaxID=3483 RepID=UPI0029CA0D7E|nr:uncharacterized protein LOC133034521 [Cannabis sativa]
MARGGGAQTRTNRDAANASNDSNRYSVLGENSRSSTANDLSNPFFLSNGDNPATVLVPKILTGSENYSTWRRSMMIALVARNKMKFVNGKIPQPDEDHEDFDAWCRCNSTVISWILHAISAEIADSIMYLDNAAEIWSELHERFNEKNAPRIYDAKKTMQNLVQGSSSVTSYFTRLKSLWDQIRELRPQPVCNCGAMKVILEQQEEDRLLEFLVGLNDSFSNVRSQILMRDPLPTVNKAYASVVQEERQRSLTSGPVGSITSSDNENSANAKCGQFLWCSSTFSIQIQLHSLWNEWTHYRSMFQVDWISTRA